MIAILVVLQSLAAILLGTVSLLDGAQRPGGGLNRRGYLLLGLGAAVFVVSTVSIQVLNDAESRRNQRRIERLIEQYFAQTAESVMTTPPAPATAPPAATGDALKITNPVNGAVVEERSSIEGTISDPSEEVWVVVHPRGTSSYWVQPLVSVSSDGDWQTTAYFGRPGIDSGKDFEIVAITDPQNQIREGDNYGAWPKARWASKPIIVTRR